MLADVARFRIFAGDLWRYLGREYRPEECRALVVRQIRDRESSFLDLLARAVYDRPASPYRALLRHVGAEHGDVAALVRGEGLEGALGRLHARGVYLSLDEFKGRRPIVRSGGLEVPTDHHDFDNASLRRGYAGVSGGSSGQPRRTIVDFGHFVHHTAYHRLFLEAFDLLDRPVVIWRPAPPARSGFSNALRSTRIGLRTEWYAQNPLGLRDVALQDWVALRTAIVATRLRGPALRKPRHVPLGDAHVIATRLDELARARTPAHFQTPAGSAVRVAAAAAREGRDLAGTFIRTGGEPLTRAKVAAIERVGARVVSNYSMSELGRVGIACADARALDDVHVLSGKVAVLQRPATRPGVGVAGLFLSSLDPTTPKIMLNVECGDTATLEEHRCGCALDALGLRLHAHTIRSYEKLTSDGTNFLGTDVIRLVEHELPAHFGGAPSDYQLLEDEYEGLPRVRLLVSPRVGAVDEASVVERTLAGLAEGPGYRAMMARIWRDGATLTVERAEPMQTPAGKIPPFLVLPRR